MVASDGVGVHSDAEFTGGNIFENFTGGDSLFIKKLVYIITFQPFLDCRKGIGVFSEIFDWYSVRTEGVLDGLTFEGGDSFPAFWGS